MTKAEISNIIYKRIIKRIVLKALAPGFDKTVSPTNGIDKKFGERLFTFSENRDIIKTGTIEKFDPDQPRDERGRFSVGSGSENGDKKSASGFKIANYAKAVVGMKTGDGVKITKCIAHAFDQIIKRDIWPQSSVNALKAKSVPAKRGRVAYIDKGTHVIVDNKTGEIITAIYKGGKAK